MPWKVKPTFRSTAMEAKFSGEVIAASLAMPSVSRACASTAGPPASWA
jgi:hypothetical protein